MGLYGTGLTYANKGGWTAPFTGSSTYMKPFSMSVWVKDTSATNFTGNAFYASFNTAAASSQAGIQSSSATLYLEELDTASVEATAGLAADSRLNVWNPFVAVFNGTASRTAYGPKGTTTTGAVAVTTENFTSFNIGTNPNTVGEYPCPVTQIIAEVAIWNCALGPAEANQIQSGISPLKIRQEKLMSYFPLRADLLDRGPRRLVLSGPTPKWGEHPPVRPQPFDMSRSLDIFKSNTVAPVLKRPFVFINH